MINLKKEINKEKLIIYKNNLYNLLNNLLNSKLYEELYFELN